MLVVKVELWPYGDPKRSREIGRMHIINKGESPTEDRGNYVTHLMRKGTSSTVQKTAEVLEYPRLSYPVWKLIKRALEALSV